jgi:hypothetical protein
MDAELEQYIIAHCRQYFLKEERQALMQISVTEGGKITLQKSALADWKVEKLYGFTNPKATELVALGGEQARRMIAQRVFDQHKNEIINLCPACGKLARTPNSQQCRHCGHDWHNRQSNL